MKTVCLTPFLSLILYLLFVSIAFADIFGSDGHTFEIEFVTIGDPGNPDDNTGNPDFVGAVDQTFRIGKYEIAEHMIDKANALGGLGLTHNNWGANKPATDLTWYEAAKFVNWLNVSTNHPVAYKFDEEGVFQVWTSDDAGYNLENVYRNSQAKYFLPSVDEWYKAAYYDPAQEIYYDYPTGSDTRPDGIDFAGDPEFEAVFGDSGYSPGPHDITDVGTMSPYGTVGQGGNVFELIETYDSVTLSNPSNGDIYYRGYRGGSWGNPWIDLLPSSWGTIKPDDSANEFGFRVASIPEPSSIFLMGIAALGLLLLRTR